MMESLGWAVASDFDDAQQLDACGYIAADAVCALRAAALTKCNSWFDVKLRNYGSLACVKQGNEILGKPGGDRVLDQDEINRLVRRYSSIDQSREAAALK